MEALQLLLLHRIFRVDWSVLLSDIKKTYLTNLVGLEG